MATIEPMTNTLALVVAHPDDEAFAAYGAVAIHSDDPDFRLALWHATDGAAGEIADGVTATPETLGQWRRAEDVAAWRALGREPDTHVWAGYPDGGLQAVGIEVPVPNR